MPSATSSFEEIQARRRTMMESGLAKRKAADRRFRWLGFLAVSFSALMLLFLLINMGSAGFAGFQRSEVRFDVPLAGSMQIDVERLTQPDPMGGLELAGLERVVDAAAAILRDAETGAEYACEPLPAHLLQMITDGGLLSHLEKKLKQQTSGEAHG